MSILSPAAAAQGAVAPHPDRPATAIIHDSPDARLVVFRLAPGQAVAPHRSSSTVVLQVLEGSGRFVAEANGLRVEHHVAGGDTIVFAPNELHGMETIESGMSLLATITPRPGGR